MSGHPDWADIVELCRRVAADVAFARIVRAEAKRTVLVDADGVDRIRWHVDQAGLGDMITVVESRFVPPGQAYVLDAQAVDAAVNEAAARWRPTWRA
ncbi:hypothetical protein AB0F93_00185 [Micromonospora tulbaghiae]|uniref:hypothetical protein n=1 Tax=Micromonospora tulbaghiae TaxID=479978 RepID=UPI003318A42D